MPRIRTRMPQSQRQSESKRLLREKTNAALLLLSPEKSAPSHRVDNPYPAVVLVIFTITLFAGSAWAITHPFHFEALPFTAYSHLTRLCMNAVTYYGELIGWILSHVTDADMFLVQSAVTCCALFWYVLPCGRKPRVCRRG